MINIKYKILIGTCPGTPKGTAEGQQGDTNNNDNNIYSLLNNIIASNEDDSTVIKFLKTKGIKDIENFLKLSEEKQEALLEEWSINQN